MKNYQNASMDDIIFEGRNQQYGAYELRQNIDRHAYIGLLTTVSIFTILMLIYNAGFFKSSPLAPLEKTVILNTADIVLPEKEIIQPKPKVQTVPPPPVNTIKNTNYQVVANTADVPPLSTQEELQKYAASTVTHIDPNLTASLPALVENTNTTGSGTGSAIVEKPVAVNTNTIVGYSEVMPTYKGGKDAMMEFLKSNIKPFDADREDRLVGKVVIRFYIDTDGSVRNPEVLKDNAGGRCAEAAIIAIKKMPKWNPGMQGNTPVKVYFTLPVSFDFSKYN